MNVKFRDVPLGGRIVICNTVWVVLETYGNGKVARESLQPGAIQSLCCFTDSEEGITLDTEVEFLGLEPLRGARSLSENTEDQLTHEKLLLLVYHDDTLRAAIREAAEPLSY